MNTGESERSHLLNQIENWGFYLLPKSHRNSLGHTGLLVAIREHPTDAHFDPETLHVRILDEDGVPEWTRFGLEWHYQKSCRVCAGRVILRDRKKKKVEFFTFGGSLESFAVSDEIVYSLRSSAPIIHVVEKPETPGDAFVFETEVQLAKLRARWSGDDADVYRRMGQADPLKLYLASVDAVLTQLNNAPQMSGHQAELEKTLREERHWLEHMGQWPVTLCTLEQILAPSSHTRPAVA
jgi:hypothetical protein